MKHWKEILLVVLVVFVGMSSFEAPRYATASLIRHIWLHDGSGNAISSTLGTLDVHTQSVHYEIINMHAVKDEANTDTLDSNASVGDSTIEVSNSSQYAVGNHITIVEGTTAESDILRVQATDGTDPGTLTLDRPLENAFTTASTVISEVDRDLSNGNGTIAAPVVYQIAPPSDETWHIRAVILHIEDGTEPTIDKFGGIASLTNGIVIRQNNGTKRNLAVIRRNGDMKEYFGAEHVSFIQKSGGGDWATNGFWEFATHSRAIVRLVGATSDTLQIIIQDDLTDLSEFEVIIQGHKEY